MLNTAEARGLFFEISFRRRKTETEMKNRRILDQTILDFPEIGFDNFTSLDCSSQYQVAVMYMKASSNSAVATIDLAAIRHNYTFAKSLAPNSKTMAMVKADAYGHGLLPVAMALAEIGVDGLGVATFPEALMIRQSGIGVDPLVVLQGAHDEESWSLAQLHKIQLMIQNPLQLEYMLSDSWPSSREVFVNVDTGMHRMGLEPKKLREALPALLAKFGSDKIVVCTHFACSGQVGLPFNDEQLRVLHESIKGHIGIQWSIANSSAILSYPEAYGNWNRTGYMIYGNSALQTRHPNESSLRPAMTVTAPVIGLHDVAEGETVGYSRTWEAKRPSRIATVAIGYGDGYPRHAANGTPVLIRGQRGACIAGRVSMDLITIDVTDISPPVEIGEIVTLWGDGLSVNEIAQWSETNGYEVLTRLMPRLQRRYINTVHTSHV